MSNKHLYERAIKLLDEYNAASAALDAQLHQDSNQVLQFFFQHLFESHPGMQKAAVLGWTPSFNDGDPCTHHTEVYVGRHRYGGPDYEDACSEVCEFFTGLEELDEDTEVGNVNGACDNTTLDKAYNAVQSFVSIIDRVYETNYKLTATLLDDGSVEVDVDDYDPGY